MESTLLETPDNEAVIGIPMSKQRFLNWNPDDGSLYEFDNGIATPADGIKKEERYLVRNVRRALQKTKAFSDGGFMFEESEIWVTDHQKRIPDIAFFTDSQIKQSTAAESEPIPAFVIEIISPTDKVKPVESKVIEYFEAGIQVVWHVHPALRMVRMFTSPRQNVTCFENDLFTAAPAISDLQMTVEELFILG